MYMMRIRKKAKTVDAFKFDYAKAKELILPNIECARIYNILFPYIKEKEKFWMNTFEGIREINDGDIIIIGTNGDNYPCKSSIFKKDYDIME